MSPDATTELVDFIVHRSFYPVLMVNRVGPDRAIIEHVQEAVRAEIARYRSYRSIEEVIASFKRDVKERPANIYSDLKLLHLPVISDLKDEFESKARQLGFEPETLLTSP